MHARTAGIAALLLVVIGGPAGAEKPQKIHTLVPGILRIGTYFVNPPFEYLAKGKMVGFEVDLMKEIALRLHLRPAFANTRWEVILQQMQDGRYDCIIGGITITSPRQQILAWSDPYLTTTLSVVIDTDRTPQIRGLADLKDAVIGVQAATTDYNVAISMQVRGEIKSVKTYPFDQIAAAITDLAAGRITAIMKVYPVAAWLVRQTPGLRIIAQIPHDPQPLGIGFDKNNPGLVFAVNAALADAKQDQTFVRLKRKWRIP